MTKEFQWSKSSLFLVDTAGESSPETTTAIYHPTTTNLFAGDFKTFGF